MKAALVTIVLMALTTYLTRAIPYLLLGRRQWGPRMLRVLEAVPGCVLVSVIAPVLVSGKPADMLAAGVTVLAALRFPLLPTVLIAVASAALFRHWL
ncbi:AzlD family protein [Neisseria leonii]|uniref:AzlD family protein n=1 Tax=Neisseria leonii TaxID=2995413 RepID=A0A9X4E5U7_9NEIS|nr:AzlD family protein [Neisseria sp. 51.81]MDD9328426.1 AzlD family protein [Neisseria sp. 51.81]